MVKPNVSHALLAAFWWMLLVRKTSALVTMVMDQQDAIALKMACLNVLLVAVATPRLAVRAKKINVPAPMARPPQERIVPQLASPSAPRAAVDAFSLMILARKTSVLALTVLVRLAPIALPMVQADALHVSVVT